MDTKESADKNVVVDKRETQEISKENAKESRKMGFYNNLALTIKSISLRSKRNVGKVLLLGDNLRSIYSAISSVFPEAYCVVSNDSESDVERFNEKLKSETSIKTRVLDIFDGSMLTDFYMEFGKFDLLVLSGMLDEHDLSNRKKRSSIVFLHKNFLNVNGILSILNGDKELSEELIKILKKIRAFKKEIKALQKQDLPLKYLIFTKKNRLKIFGE